MVDRYTTQLVQMLVSEYTPAQICAELGLCNKGITVNNINNNVNNDIFSNDIPILEDNEDYLLDSSEEISDYQEEIASMGSSERMVRIYYH
jgi:hypothetical protein